MSGIFGYIGSQPCKDILISGIDALEKRGAESTGIALKINNEILSVRTKGNAKILKQKAQAVKGDAYAGIAQTDNAYRCTATQITAKPACNNLFAVAMDGNIENFDSLKRWSNNPFPINTDEDLMLAMLCISNHPDKIELIKKIVPSVQGNPTYVFMANDENALYCKAGSRPLVIGLDSEGFFISSEINALIRTASKYIVLEDGECAKITKEKAVVFDGKYKKIKKPLLSMPDESYFENDYPLSDEIFYCPLTVKETYNTFVDNSKLNFDYLKLNRHSIDKISRIIITGSSSSLNAARISCYNFDMLTDIPSVAVAAGELRYSGMVIDKNTLLIAISHRGENSDVTACVKRAQSFGAKTIAVTSNHTSYLARLCDNIINPNCDFDSNDISIRSFISTYLAMCFLTLYIGWKNGVVTELYLNVTIKMAEMLPGKISSAIKNTPLIDKTAEKMLYAKNVFVTGLGADYALSFEAAQKLREISKINASAYCCSELLNTAGSLLDETALVLAIITNKELLQKSLYNLRRAKALGAQIIIITVSNIEEEITDFENIISYNDSIPIFNVLPCITGIYKLAISANELRAQNDVEKVG